MTWMKNPLPVALTAVVATSLAAAPTGWRGDGRGVYPTARPPLEWSAKPPKNVAWHVHVGSSYSSPIVVGDGVFVTSEPDKLLCVARTGPDAGKVLWEKTVGFADLPAELHAKDPKLQTSCGYTTPTPVSDGKNVYAVMGTGIVASFDLEGNRNWITYLNVEPTTPYGRSAPPRLVDDLLIAPMDLLHALDARTGKLVWKSPDADSGYGACAVAEVPGGGGAAGPSATKVLVTPRGSVVRVKDGKVLAKEVGNVEYASPIAQGDTVYFVAAQCSAVKLSAKGPAGPDGPDAVEAKELWTADLDGEFFASPVLHDGFLYTLNKDAVYDVIDAKTGKVALTGPLQLPPKGEPGEPTGTFAYPSVSLAGGKLFVGNTRGDWEVLDPAARADVKAAQIRLNTLPDGSPASPAFADRQIFIRVGAQLYCIAAPEVDHR